MSKQPKTFEDVVDEAVEGPASAPENTPQPRPINLPTKTPDKILEFTAAEIAASVGAPASGLSIKLRQQTVKDADGKSTSQQILVIRWPAGETTPGFYGIDSEGG